MPTLVQVASAGTDFDGTAGQGLFVFSTFNLLPTFNRVWLRRVFLSVLPDGEDPGVAGNVLVTLERPSSPGPTITLLSLAAADLSPIFDPVTGRANWYACDTVLPREAVFGNWQVAFYVTSKAGLGWAGVDYEIETPRQPDTSGGPTP